MVNYMLLTQKLAKAIEENEKLRELTVYKAMFLLNNSKYEIVVPVLDHLCDKNVLRKEGRKYVIVAREYDLDEEAK